MNRERKYIYKTFINKNGTINIESFSNITETNDILDKFFKSKDSDHPDFYYLDNDCCYIFEYFEVDASYRSKNKGSQYIRNRVKADAEIESETQKLILQNPPKNNGISNIGTISKTVFQNANISNLRTNFLEIFDEHYKEIEKYKQDITNKEHLAHKNFKVIFIIEHTTELGGFYLLNNNNCRFLLHYSDFVIDKLKKSNMVDYVIFLDKNLEQKQFVFMKNGEFENLSKKIIDTNKTHIMFFNDITDISVTLYVPKSKLKLLDTNK